MGFYSDPNDLQAAIDALMERARKIEKQPPRKHHLIPASYLVRWEQNRRLRVTETDGRKSYPSRANQAARETDFYLLASNDVDSDEVPPLLLETLLSEVEGSAKGHIDTLIRSGPTALGPEDAIEFGMFLAFQTTRGRTFRAQIAEMFNQMELLRWQGVTDAGIRQHLSEIGDEPSDENVASHRKFLSEWRAGKWRATPNRAALAGWIADAAPPLVMYFLGRRWLIYHSVLPLITCDEPVVTLPYPDQGMTATSGIATAGAMLFPLDPHHLLVMFHPYFTLDALARHPDLMPSEAEQVNLIVAGNSDRWLFDVPKATRTLSMSIPPLPDERTMVDNVGRGTVPSSELFRTHTPGRWHTTAWPPPHPVPRWWSAAPFLGPHRCPYNPATMPYAMFNDPD